MLPLLSLRGSDTGGGKKRNAEGVVEDQYVTIARAVQAYDAKSSNIWGQVFRLTKYSISHFGMNDHETSNHLAHYLYKLTNHQTHMLQFMLAARHSVKSSSGSTPVTAESDVHLSNKLIWMANVAGKRKPSTRTPDVFSKAESFVKQAVALERLHETHSAERDGVNYAARFIDILHVEMKIFNDGAIEFLNTSTDPMVKLNNPVWFAKYRSIPWNSPEWM